MVRQNFDYYLDCEEEGKKVQKPFIFTISKDLNQTLDEFYNKHALKEAADDWLDKHDYKDAVVDDDDKVWMDK
ncbi:hypothetical protein E4U56_002082 [Claviceps arundinis]|uniref:Uncharacterized protein n=1 Tax=Claviceps arundinis TaxID=1623583 RepID=A0A9P7SPR5_9HYPO|nr:hypothetical protein E4U56_002082 [Claviceps arundinis]